MMTRQLVWLVRMLHAKQLCFRRSLETCGCLEVAKAAGRPVLTVQVFIGDKSYDGIDEQQLLTSNYVATLVVSSRHLSFDHIL